MDNSQDVWDARRSGDVERVKHDLRPEEERDRSRIIHSFAFRRLQGKTQVLGIGENDFYRTRLTHSMEVAQIARGIVLQLRAMGHGGSIPSELVTTLPDTALIESVAFAHDIGHPPYGHGGEIALNYLMRNDGGFEANGQTLRLMSKLQPHTEHYGLDLTRRTLLGTLKYPANYSSVVRRRLPADPGSGHIVGRDWTPPKCYLDSERDVVEWLLEPLGADASEFTRIEEPVNCNHGKTLHKSLDASIMDLADDIAYGVHDLEDSISMGLLTIEHWKAVRWDPKWATEYGLELEEISESIFEPRVMLEEGQRKIGVGKIIHALIASITIKKHPQFEAPLIMWGVDLLAPARSLLDSLKSLISKHVIMHQSVQALEYRGRYIITWLFDALVSDWERLLSPIFRAQVIQTGDVKRGVCDYVAGMTDTYASALYGMLFDPTEGSVFKRL